MANVTGINGGLCLKHVQSSLKLRHWLGMWKDCGYVYDTVTSCMDSYVL